MRSYGAPMRGWRKRSMTAALVMALVGPALASCGEDAPPLTARQCRTAWEDLRQTLGENGPLAPRGTATWARWQQEYDSVRVRAEESRPAELDSCSADVDAAAARFDRLVDLLPATFRADWGMRVHRAKGVAYGTSAAPDDFEFIELEGAERMEVEGDENTLYAAARLDGNDIVVIGRRGGPDFLDSELARLGHLAALAVTIATA